MEDAGNAADTLEDAVASNQQAGKPGLENSAGQNLDKLPKTDVNRIAEDSGFDVTSVVTPMKAEPATETSTAMPLAKAMTRTAGRRAAAAAKAVAGEFSDTSQNEESNMTEKVGIGTNNGEYDQSAAASRVGAAAARSGNENEIVNAGGAASSTNSDENTGGVLTSESMLGKSTTSRLTRSGGATPVVATGSEGASRNCCTTKAHSLSEQNPTLTYYDSYLFSLRGGGLYIKDFSLPRKCCSILEPHISYQHVISTTHLPI